LLAIALCNIASAIMLYRFTENSAIRQATDDLT